MHEIAVSIKNLTKMYPLYNKPIDRLKEAFHPLRKIYHKEFYALKDITFDVTKGEVIGLIGQNGSGKSTLLKIITGVLSPTNGDLNINGSLSALLELGAGFNPQYSGLENIYLSGSIMGLSKKQIDDNLQEIIDFADIGDFLYQPVMKYSSGMFARLAFSVAISVDPDILIVDEALSVGDTNFQLKCMEKFNTFREKGKTIFFVSHDINAIKRYCSRTLWLKNGTIEAQGDTQRVADMYMDYLKALTSEQSVEEVNSSVGTPGVGEIIKVTMMNSRGELVDSINFGDSVSIKIDYNMFSNNLKNIVVGVAIRSIDNKYICGINTLLDKFPIPYKIGENSIILEYKSLNLLGGTYYLQIAMFDSNAHVYLHDIVRAKKFFINAPYIGEGICVLEHSWRIDNE